MINKLAFSCANLENKDEILLLYKSSRKNPFSVWTDDYPNMETIISDVNEKSLFILKNENNEIIAAISLDKEEEFYEAKVKWQFEGKAIVLSRLAVKEEYQNLGISQIIFEKIIDKTKDKYQVLRAFISPSNKSSLALSRKNSFTEAGDIHLFHQDFIAFERKI